MKFTEESYNLISEILEREANNVEGEYRQEIETALSEVDAIGTY